MVNFGIDLLIILGTCLVGLVGAFVAYRIGAPVWPLEFQIPSIKKTPEATKKLGFELSSGEIGEAANLLLIAGICALLLIVTPDANLTDLWIAHWLLYLFALAFCVLVVFLYTRYAVAKVKREGFNQKPLLQNTDDNIKLLARGYLPYVAYGTAVSTIIIGYIAALTITQFMLDHAQFQAINAVIEARIARNNILLQPEADVLLARFEIIFGDFQVAEGYIRDQVNSLIMVLLCVMLAYAGIYRSELRHVYAKSALDILQYIVFGLVALCVVVGCTVFFTTHLTFVDGVLDHLRQYRSVMDQSSWDMVQRYHALISELSRQRGVFGFLLGLTTDRGGLVLVIPVLQLLIGRAKERETRNA